MDSMRDKIVTARSFERPMAKAGAEEEESPGAEAELPEEAKTPEGKLKIEQYAQIMQRLQTATEDVGPDVMVTLQDREVSLAQSRLAEEADAATQLQSGGQEVQFGTGLAGMDWFRWIWSLTDHVQRKDAHPIVRPTAVAAAPLPPTFSVAMVADWGTGLYGAPKSAASICRMAKDRQKPFDLALHLGDVYYSGTKKECEDRFIKMWPTDAATTNRALNGNHEMYSGGFGYFDEILPAFSQRSSYFAFQSDHWLLACLDTAYVDHDMDTLQVAWLNEIIKQADASKRKVVLFSHQQPFSRLDEQGPKLQVALKPLLRDKTITAWYWGHEHQCVIYDQHPQWGLLGRCLGHGGIPEPRKAEVRAAPADPAFPGGAGCTWRRLDGRDGVPPSIALDGNNMDMDHPSDQQKFVPHGFMTLEFDNDRLTERVFTSGGIEIYKKTIP
jgi:hypothetical protein